MIDTRSLINFVKTDMWRIRLKELTQWKSILLRSFRIIVLSFKEFDKDKCMLRASALTFYTLLSIVPLVAMAFGIAKGFGLEDVLARELLKNARGQEEIINRIIQFSNNMLDNTKGGLVSGVGVIILFWTIIKVLGNIERSFNDIFGVPRMRTFARKVSDYLFFMLISPFVFIISSSMTVLVTKEVTSKMHSLAETSSILAWIDSLTFMLKIIPISMTWMLFAFTYLFMPNTRVKFRSGLLGGIVAGTLYYIVQVIYIKFQIGASKYGAIYGSFAALPLFLIWLQISWQLVLYGAEVSFAHQNVDTYEFEPDCQNVSPHNKRLVALGVVRRCVRAMDEGEPALTSDEIAHHLEAPVRLVNLVIYELVQANVLVEVLQEGESEAVYYPARNIESMTILSVFQQLDNTGLGSIPINNSEELKALKGILVTLHQDLLQSSANAKIKDLLSSRN